MNAQRPCDWQRDWQMPGHIHMECTNCADYRSEQPDASHRCEVIRNTKLQRKYGYADPALYPQPTACVRCIAANRAAACDADPLLEYACTSCRGPNGCVLPSGRTLPPRPNPRQGATKWMRRACDSCWNLSVGRSGNGLPQPVCNWISDRTSWGRACSRCAERKMLCNDGPTTGGHIPHELFPPDNWEPISGVAEGWAELRPTTPWRKTCIHCVRDGNHCRVACNRPFSACNRCTQLGIDCIDADGLVYPLFDLAQVGFGLFMPFPNCARCTEMGRNCDKQRPCDSCVGSGEGHLCDQRATAGKMKARCLWTRLHPQPGPMYYLGLGYGSGGVNDVKTNRLLEDWVGPPEPAYGYDAHKRNSKSLIHWAKTCREAMLPPGIPPFAFAGAPDASNLGKNAPSWITVGMIRHEIGLKWPAPFPPRRHPFYYPAVLDAQRGVYKSMVIDQRAPGDASGATSVDNGDNDAEGEDVDGGADGDGADDDDDAPMPPPPPPAVVAITGLKPQLPVGAARPGATAVDPRDLHPTAPTPVDDATSQVPQGNTNQAQVQQPPQPAAQSQSGSQMPQGPSNQAPVQQSGHPPAQFLVNFQLQQGHTQQAPIQQQPQPAAPSQSGFQMSQGTAHQVPAQQPPQPPAQYRITPYSQYQSIFATLGNTTSQTAPTPPSSYLTALYDSRLPSAAAQNALVRSPPFPLPAALPPDHTAAQEEPSSHPGHSADGDVAMADLDDSQWQATIRTFTHIDSASDTEQGLPPAPQPNPSTQGVSVDVSSSGGNMGVNNQQAAGAGNIQPSVNTASSQQGANVAAPQQPANARNVQQSASTASGVPAELANEPGVDVWFFNERERLPPGDPRREGFAPEQRSPQAVAVVPPSQAPRQSNFTPQVAPVADMFGAAVSQADASAVVVPQGGSFAGALPAMPIDPTLYMQSNAATSMPPAGALPLVPMSQLPAQAPSIPAVGGNTVLPEANSTRQTYFNNLQQLVTFPPLFSEAPSTLATSTLAPSFSQPPASSTDDDIFQTQVLFSNLAMDPNSVPDPSSSSINTLQNFGQPASSSDAQNVERSPSERPDDPDYVKPRWRRLNPYHRNDRSWILMGLGVNKQTEMETLKWKILARVLNQPYPSNPLRNVLGTVPEVDYYGQPVADLAPNDEPSGGGSGGNAGAGSITGPLNASLASIINTHGFTSNTTNQSNASHNTSSPNRQYLICDEHKPGDLIPTCGKTVPRDHQCVSREHGAGLRPFVCNSCAKESSKALVDERHKPITGDEIRRMRAYLCDDCTSTYGSQPRMMMKLRTAGFSSVWGLFGPRHDSIRDEVTWDEDGAMRFFPSVRALTGCSCAEKMMRARLCRFHRFENAERALHWANRAREWRMQTFGGKAVCPACVLTKSWQDANEATDEPPLLEDGTAQPDPPEKMRAWACFSCSGWVINQANKPKLVPGWHTWYRPWPAVFAENWNASAA